MAILVARNPDPPFRDEPGRCPRCGIPVRPRDENVVYVGVWDGREPDGRPTGGPTFATNCSECGVVLVTHLRSKWTEAEASGIHWHTRGERWLVGGDRWRGRPGAWSPEDAPRHEARLRNLRAQFDSLEEAVCILHTTTGLGALPIAGLVERVAGLAAKDAKRLVVRALAPHENE